MSRMLDYLQKKSAKQLPSSGNNTARTGAPRMSDQLGQALSRYKSSQGGNTSRGTGGVIAAPNGNTGVTGIGLPKGSGGGVIAAPNGNTGVTGIGLPQGAGGGVIAAPNGNTGITGIGLPQGGGEMGIPQGEMPGSIGIPQGEMPGNVIAAPNGNTGVTGIGLPQGAGGAGRIIPPHQRDKYGRPIVQNPNAGTPRSGGTPDIGRLVPPSQKDKFGRPIMQNPKAGTPRSGAGEIGIPKGEMPSGGVLDRLKERYGDKFNPGGQSGWRSGRVGIPSGEMPRGGGDSNGDGTIDNLDGMRDEFMDSVGKGSEAYYEGQKAQLDAAKAQRLAELDLALKNAIADGQLSEQEAMKMFQAESEKIDEEAYIQSQATNLNADARGIGSSQQLLAMQSGDMRASNNLRSDARTARDDRVSQIKDRLSRIKNQNELDVSTTNSKYNADLRGARAEADRMKFDALTNMSLSEYKSALELKNNLTLAEKQQLHELQRMEKQQGYDLEKMKVGQTYDLEKLAKQHGYDLENLKVGHGYKLDEMKVGHGYDLDKLKVGHGYDMAKMAKQFSYDKQLSASRGGGGGGGGGRSGGGGGGRSGGGSSAKSKYDEDLDRLNRAYTPGTKEYNIRKKKLDAELEAESRRIENRSKQESKSKKQREYESRDKDDDDDVWWNPIDWFD